MMCSNRKYADLLVQTSIVEDRVCGVTVICTILVYMYAIFKNESRTEYCDLTNDCIVKSGRSNVENTEIFLV